MRTPLTLIAATLLAAPAGVYAASCSDGARTLRLACDYDIRDDYHSSLAHCRDKSAVDPECLDDAEAELSDAAAECSDILAARLELCESQDDAPHEPGFGEAFAANFVNPLEVGAGITPNPWFPLVQGNTWVYADESESITVTVTDEVRLIEGIPCLTVNDVVREDGELVEDTDDWFAQDMDGNVWYCGEIAKNYEDGELTDVEGSWKSGRDGGKAGILLPFAPVVGSVIRQEVDFGNAEDVIEIESLTDSETAVGGACSGNCLRTRDYTPLDAEANENKYYAPGIGLIVEIDLESGGRVELIEFTGAGS